MLAHDRVETQALLGVVRHERDGALADDAPVAEAPATGPLAADQLMVGADREADLRRRAEDVELPALACGVQVEHVRLEVAVAEREDVGVVAIHHREMQHLAAADDLADGVHGLDLAVLAAH